MSVKIVFLLAMAAQAAPIEDAYRAAKAAIESGDAARAVELLAPFDRAADADAAQLAVARIALGRAYLRLGKAIEARDALARIGPLPDESPHVVAVSALLGDAHRLLGASEDAGRAYALVAKLAGNAVLGRYAAARVSELQAEAAEEKKEFAKAAGLYLAAGDALLGLGVEDNAYYADARALFEKVAKGSDKASPGKDWRGEPTARAVFSIGEVERMQQHYPEAIAYYQRTFVSWLKYPAWPARAYLRAAECMDKLGKREFAIRHLREMMRKPDKFGKLPEFQEAKKQLRAWGQEVR